jgi:MFS family permease
MHKHLHLHRHVPQRASPSELAGLPAAIRRPPQRMEGLVSDDTPTAAPAAVPPSAAAGTVRSRPATFRDAFAVPEYRAVYAALLVNWVGDYLARAAITVLVYQSTHSILLSAASFAIGYVPWVVGGPLLAALAERYPYKRVMITCDLSRMVIVGLIALPHLPLPLVLLFALLGMLAGPPTQAARSALLPLMLQGDRLVVALAINGTTTQAAQVFGYLVGATVAAASSPRLTIAGVALLFGLSALLVAIGVRGRPAANRANQSRHLLHETAAGFRLVFGNRVLRPIAILVFTTTMFAIVPEGLAAGWAGEISRDPAARGLDQGVIMAAGPVGWIIGGLLINRFIPLATRQRLIGPLSIAAAVALVPSFLAPPVPVVVALILLSGIAQGGTMPTLNGLFVLALPHGFRARAFGVMQGGMQICQGLAVVVTGGIAERSSVPVTVGLWSVGGALVMIAIAARWPRPAVFEQEITAAAATAPEPPRGPTAVARARVPARSATRVTPHNG